MHGRVRLPGLMAVLAMTAFGQGAASNGAVTSGAGTGLGGPGIVAVFEGVPYSAEQIVERMRTAADGTQIAEEVRESKVYRDSAGRTRVERATGMHRVVIVDPIAHVSYSLDAEKRVAHMRVIHTAPKRPGAIEGTVGTRRARAAVEQLGDKIMEGVLVSGTRGTIILPGRGGEQARVMVREVWGSRELHLMVLSAVHDPLRGDSRQRMVQVSRAEPDAKLFRVPVDYQIVDDDAVRREELWATAAASAPERMVRADEQSQPGPVQAQAEAAPNDTPVEDQPASFADAPAEDYAADGDAGDYIGVNTVYLGVGGKTPLAGTSRAVVASGSAATPAKPKQPNPKIPKKTPGTEKPAQVSGAPADV